MASDLFKDMGGSFNLNQFMNRVNELKRKGGNPEEMIQNMLSSGRVTQEQVNAATQRANQIMQMLTIKK